MPAGDFAIVAQAIDNHGQIRISEAVNVHIVAASTNIYVDAGPARSAQLSVYGCITTPNTRLTARPSTPSPPPAPANPLTISLIFATLAVATDQATLETNYLNRALLWCETMVTKATVIDTGGKKNWRGIWASPWHSTTNIAYQLEDFLAGMTMLHVSRTVLQDTRLKAVWGMRDGALQFRARPRRQ